jgi:diadenosine tetraphosphate (Ap4A) HIT family hydrolase
MTRGHVISKALIDFDIQPSQSIMSEMICNNCTFCRLILNKRKFDHCWDTVLLESENFIALPTKGSLIEGWLLIVPKNHFIAMGSLYQALWKELKEFVTLVSTFLEERYSKPILFEHGPSCTGRRIGCGVDHAHFHLVPLKSSITKHAIKRIGPPTIVSMISFWSGVPLSTYYSRGIDYLFLHEKGKDVSIWLSPVQESQIFRRIIAAELGIPDEYDYRNFHFKSNVIKTVRKLSNSVYLPYFSKSILAE